MVARPRVTIAEIAEIAKVSTATVSRVLNDQPGVSEKNRERILQSINDLGYAANPIARSLRGASNVIALIVSDIKTLYTGAMIQSISQAANSLNYGIMLYTHDHTLGMEGFPHYLSLLNSGFSDGVLLLVTHDYKSLVQAFKEHELPFVLIDQRSDVKGEPAITVTNYLGTKEAIRYLIALGHRRIGFIKGLMTMGCSAERLSGYYDVLNEMGIPVDEDLVRQGDFLQPGGFKETKALLELSEPPTAIFASNDLMAFGAMDAIKDKGLKVGKHVSVIGFDDITSASQVYPTLTTVRQPIMEIGTRAVELLNSLIQGKQPSNMPLELPTQFIIRKSTAQRFNS